MLENYRVAFAEDVLYEIKDQKKYNEALLTLEKYRMINGVSMSSMVLTKEYHAMMKRLIKSGAVVSKFKMMLSNNNRRLTLN